MAAQVEVQTGEVGRTVVGGRLHLSPLTDSSNKGLNEISSINQSHIISPEPNKPSPVPKPRLTPKPFAMERNPTIKPILAPKPQTKPRPESTRLAGYKPEPPCSLKPQQPVATGKPRPLSTNPSRPSPTSFKMTNRLNTGQTTKPVAQPFKPAPPLDLGDSSKPRQKPRASNLVYSKSLKQLPPSEWSGTTKNQDEKTKSSKSGGSISRAKSMGFLAQVGKEEEEKEKENPEAAVLLRPKPRGSRPRPVSAIFLDSPTETPAPSLRWARRPLSADLTAKFESIGLSLHRKTPTANTNENAPQENEPAQNREQEKPPKSITQQSTDGLSKENAEEDKRAVSIKSRISLLLDSSSSPGTSVSAQGSDPHSSVQLVPDTEPPVGVQQIIRQLTEDPSPVQSPTGKPAPRPRPLPFDLTKRFSSERSPDLGNVFFSEATDRDEISKDPQRRIEEAAITPSDQRTFVHLNDSQDPLKNAPTPEGPEAGEVSGGTSKESVPRNDAHTVKASLFENVVERHCVVLGEDKRPVNEASDSLRSPPFKSESGEDDGTNVTATHQEPLSPSSPLRVTHAFDTVQGVEGSRAVSENLPSAQWEDKAMTLRSRRSEGAAAGPPASALMPEQQPRILRVGALQKWNSAGAEATVEKGGFKESQRGGQGARQLEAEQEEVAAAPKRLKMLQSDEQPKPRATYFALTGQIQEPSSPVDGGAGLVKFDDFSVRSALGGPQGKLLTTRRNPSLDKAFEKNDRVEDLMMRGHISQRGIRSTVAVEEIMQEEKRRELQKETERHMAKMNELFLREKQRLLEVEEEAHLEFAQMKERERQREFERQRQKAFEKEKQEFEEQQRALESQKQLELEQRQKQELERARLRELEKERQLQHEKERQQKIERQRMIERERLQEQERVRQRMMEKERLQEQERERQRMMEKERLQEQERERQRMMEKERLQEQERERQRMMEKERLQEQERERQRMMEKERLQEQERERQRMMEKERLQEQERERQRMMEKERLQEQERERKREQERQRQKEEERQRELDKERQLLEVKRENQRLQELRRIKEQERLQLLQFEKQMQKEKETQQLMELEAQRLREKTEREAEKMKQMAIEQEVLRMKELVKEKERQKEMEKEHRREVEREKQRELERQRQRDLERERQRQLDNERQELENQRLRQREVEKERQRKEELEQIKEMERRRLLELEKQKQAERDRQHTLEAEKRRLRESAERGEAEKMRHIAKQQEGERQRLKERQKREEQERARMEASHLWPQALEPDSVRRNESFSRAPSQRSDPATRWKEPSPRGEASYRPAILDIDSFTSQVQPSPGKDLFPVPGVQGSDAAFGGRLHPPSPDVDVSWRLPQQTPGITSPVWTTSPQDPWELRPVEMPADKPVAVTRQSSVKLTPAQLLLRQGERLSAPQRLPSSAPQEQVWHPREQQQQQPPPLPLDSKGEVLSQRRSQGSQVQQKQSDSGEEEGKDSGTPVRDTDSQYGTWETGLRTDDSLTPATPSSESNPSPSSRKPTPTRTSGDHVSPFETDALDSLVPPPSFGSQPIAFPDTPTTLLDTSALRSRAHLGKKRAPRTRPSRAARQSEGDGGATEDWLYTDSTEAKAETKDNDSDSGEPTKGADASAAASFQPQRIALFPGMDPSALKAQLRKRGDSDNQIDGAAPAPSQLSRSPKSPFLPRAARVLPPSGGKENGEEDSPQWLKELKSKKRLSQYDNES
ncbi:uncharacterized protein AB9W97_013089 isoform 2-T7 [Spinachia spinachia]